MSGIITLEPAQFNGAVGSIWSDRVLYHYNCIRSDAHKVEYLSNVISKLDFIASLSQASGKVITASVQSDDLIFPISDIYKKSVQRKIASEFNDFETQCKKYCKNYAISTEICFVNAQIEREHYNYYYILGPKDKYSVSYIKKHGISQTNYDSSITWYSPELYDASVQVHFHLITDKDSYKNLQDNSADWRMFHEISMVKSKGTVSTTDMPKLAQYISKCNVIAPSSQYSFNRFRFDLPFNNRKNTITRLLWMKHLPRVSTFKGNSYAIGALICYLRTVQHWLTSHIEIQIELQKKTGKNWERLKRIGMITRLYRIHNNKMRWERLITSALLRQLEKFNLKDSLRFKKQSISTMICYDATRNYRKKAGIDPPSALAA